MKTKTKIGIAGVVGAAVVGALLFSPSPAFKGDDTEWMKGVEDIPYVKIEYVKIPKVEIPATSIQVASITSTLIHAISMQEPYYIESELLSYTEVEREALRQAVIKHTLIPRSKENILAMICRWKQTRETVAMPRAPLPIRPFYVTEGQYLGEHRTPYTKHRKQLVFRFIDDDWRETFAATLHLIPTSLCVLDFRVSEFDGPLVEEFVRETGAQEVVLSWSYANTIDQPETQAAMAKDVEGALEFVKRGNEKCFVWVTVCVGAKGTSKWIELIKDLPFDGVALWGPYYVPASRDAKKFLTPPLLWAKKKFGDKPVALAGFFGAKGVWRGNKKTQLLAPGEANKIIPIAKELGYSAVWLQTGYHPERSYWKPK